MNTKGNPKGSLSNSRNPKGSLSGIFVAIVFIVVSIFCALTTSCTKRVYVPVETIKENIVYRTDTLRQITQSYDSIYVRDSIALIQRNDTVFLTKWRDQFKYIYRTDTIHESKADSVYIYKETPKPYEVEVVKEVAKPLAWWQKTLMWLGVAFFALLAFTVYRLFRKHTP